MEEILKSDKIKLLFPIVASLLILSNIPIVSTTLVVLLFMSSSAVIGTFLYSKYFDNSVYEDALTDSVIKYQHKYAKVGMIIIILGLLFGGYYLTTILYCITSLLINATYEAHKEG